MTETVAAAPVETRWSMFRRGFWVNLLNPKAIVFFLAFLPQFVDVARPAAAQFFVLGVVFVMLEWVAIAAYAYMGSHLRQWFSAPARRRLFNRICGALLGFAGVGLLLSRRSAG